MTRGHGDTVFDKMFSCNFTNWSHQANRAEMKYDTEYKKKKLNKVIQPFRHESLTEIDIFLIIQKHLFEGGGKIDRKTKQEKQLEL